MTITEVLYALDTEVQKAGLRAEFYAKFHSDGQRALWRTMDGIHILVGYLLLGDDGVEGFVASQDVAYRDVPTFLHALDAARG